ncbi:clamp loader subunit [Sinorhizobium phage phiM9]|uniref:Clamp loader subunit n=1 Tax=Sinorhizobium phage phiM9 TaxID=1636182 RepID=A0A0F6R641_9CAUD|nr:clamp loader subunit [Sinorhizobium phage phiM9]AKE44875.1 clamp loader subunit [Sinorhizobium phage phiM9]
MASPFDLVKSASSSIENEVLSGKLEMKEGDSFVFLRSFANFEDTVLYADELNLHPGIPARYKYHFMHFFTNPKRNRFAKWTRPVEEFSKETVARAIDIFEVSRTDALNILRKLQDEGRLGHFEEKYVGKKEKKK